MLALMNSVGYPGAESLSEVDEQGRQSVPTPSAPANSFVGSAFQLLYISPSLG